MNKLKHVIFTSSDAKYGEFIIDHWLKSLQENVNLSNIDIVILDYGLSRRQTNELKNRNVTVKKCVKDGHVTSIRFRDIKNFLASHEYDQVLSADGGDIIFQTDISHIFESDKDSFRAAYEEVKSLFGDFFRICFRPEDQKKILKSLKSRNMINAGFLLGPSDKFIKLCDECNKMILMKKLYGPDQVAIDYILHRDGFKILDSKYNFIINSAKHPFHIKHGEFFFNNGEKICVVHNAGSVNAGRSIKNFGYGKEYNKIKKMTYHSLRGFFKFVNLFQRRKKS